MKKKRTEIKDKIRTAEEITPRLKRSMENCDLCVRKCGVNRLEGEKGFCSSGAKPLVYSARAHHGEEPPLSGWNGSGTIFFSRCSMRCVYCQNYQFSQADSGKKVSARELADIMLKLKDAGCHNINLVTPTHQAPAIVEALGYAHSDGLDIPIVYNTGGYDSLHVIQALRGLIDIYLPDMRYSSDEMAEKYSQAPGYVANNRAILKEMHRQSGRLELSHGIAIKGLIIRLLIMPGGISGTEKTLEFISESLGRDTYLSVMSQYYPAYKASGYKELAGRINRDEYESVMERMRKLDLREGWVQPFEGEFDARFAGENFPPDM